VKNVDSQRLLSVVVTSSTLTQEEKIGDLSSGHRSCVWVNADNEASVSVSYRMQSGASIVVPLYGYIEPGYTGWISAEVSSNGAHTITEDVDSY
jgi:hypothetical protein